MRYQIAKRNVDGLEVLSLIDKETDTECEITPEIGNNLISFCSQGDDYISNPPTLDKLKDEAGCYQYGNAILFPPNRVKNATYTFNDRTYQLPRNEDPNHLHGELCFKPWKVIETNVDPDHGCSITSQFKLEDDPEIMGYFSHKLVFTLTYTLKNGKLELRGKIENLGEDESPFALGFHPYFTIPNGEEDKVRLTVPAINEWPVSSEAFVQGLPKKSKFSEEFSNGMTLEDVQDLDCWLVTLEDSKKAYCHIDYLESKKRLTYQLDTTVFPYVVIFKPDWSSAISLEPYTYVTDGFNLPYPYETTGAKGIKPDEQINFHLAIEVSSS